MKRIRTKALSLLLALVMLLGMVPAVSALGGFSDVTDMTTAQNLEVLQMMGVVDGMAGSAYNPTGTLTRAQFCKMAVEALGEGDRVNIYKNYTIFPDVKPDYWGAGYVNLATRTTTGGEDGTRLITGFSDGTFRPNDTITYGQAITILMRMLGYGDTDVSAVWPDGYIDLAMTNGLSDGVRLSGGSAVNRGQAAQLFVNLLNTKQKSGGPFYERLGTPQEAILLNANAVDSAGNHYMMTSAGDYDLAGTPASGLLSGRKGVVILNSNNEAITFIPTNEGTSRNITIAKAEASTITDSSGAKYTVATDAKAYIDNQPQNYAEAFSFLRSGTLATLYINSKGRVETVFVGSTTSDDAVIVGADGSTDGFSLLTTSTDYKIYKHGEEIRPKDLKQFDVATYSSSNNTIYISDNRMTVYYQNAYPNTEAPSYIKATGIIGGASVPGNSEEKSYLEVMPCAMESISQCKVGQTITLLLTENNKVAGVSTSSAARGNAIGYVDGEGQLTLFNGLTVDQSALGKMDSYHGQLVTVSSYNRSSLSVNKLSGRGSGSDFDVAARRVGDTSLSADVRIYEKAGNSALTEVTLDQLTGTIPSEKIVYAHKNSMGKIDILVLENASGAGFIYGRVHAESKQTGSFAGQPIYNMMITVDSGGKTYGEYMCAGFQSGITWGGIVPNVDGERVSAYVILDAVKNVSTSSFRSSTLVYHNGRTYEVSEDVVCYNKASGTWLSLGAALAFADKCTLYIDDNNIVRGVEVGQ